MTARSPRRAPARRASPLSATFAPAAEARLGFCCKFMPPIPPEGDKEAARAAREVAKAMNLTTTTMAYLQRQEEGQAREKLVAIVAHNLEALLRQIDWVGARPPMERLLRLASSVLPGYTHPAVRGFYADPDFRRAIEAGLAAAGERARALGVRLSLHPGPFCILATANPAALTNAVEELDYHAEVMALMGYHGGWHPHGAHINIHVGAREPGVETFRANLARVSQGARDLVTVENDETSYGLDDVLELSDLVPVVLDLHHHWIASGGAYLEPDDPRVDRIVAAWRGVRPVSHISVSREEYLVDHDPGVRPDFAALVAGGVRARDLIGHSDMMWNTAVNALVARHLAWSDFEIEAKFKNLASEGIAAEIAAMAIGDGRGSVVLPVAAE